MANGFTDWSGWNIGSPTADAFAGFGNVPARPEALGTLEDYRTPGEDLARFMSQAQPFWTTRAPMADIGQRLRARYLLAAPGMAEQGGISPSFGQFLSDYPSRFGADPTFAAYGAGTGGTAGQEIAELRRRAGEAARAATTAPAAYMGGADPETAEFRRRAWLASQFGADAGAQTAMENQMRVANLLALQRQGGGAYRGQMADAIRGAMGNLYQQRLNVGAPRENFLSWYLQRTDPTYATQEAEL